ncbi:MAG: sulfotransferase [Pseudomonadota bacterium]
MASRSLPHSIVIGAPKCGTTTLCNALARHPQIFMYPKKETHFFNFYYESRGLDWYRSLFNGADDGAHLMEGTPDYVVRRHLEAAMARIARDIPDVRLIYMVREPLARIESHYAQALSNERRFVPIGEAVERWPDIVETSKYAETLDIVHAHVPPERVLVLHMEDYRDAPERLHRAVLDFLGLRSGPEELAALAEQERTHTRESLRADSALLAWLRRSRWYDRVNMLMPRWLIERLKPLVRRKVVADYSWDEADRARIAAAVEADYARFLAAHPRLSAQDNPAPRAPA